MKTTLEEEIRQIIEFAQRDAVIYVEEISKGNKDAVLPNPLDISKVIIFNIKKRIFDMVNTTTRYEVGEWKNFYKGFDTAIEKVNGTLK